ncbi:protein kinase [Kitasatospora sp. NBC_00315]|uniref:serine/threonine-protein kinase n=1 Tax=Kitasatospora sp. NBC_00315 TaxID=2975963 RepID=UPI00324581FD
MNTGAPDARLVDGRFELLQRLGGGGMGLVWRARDNVLHREVALKEVRALDPAMAAADPDAARETRERVLREARACARLQHPNVAVIHHIVDSAEHPHPWLVMELVTGGSLADRLARGPLTVPEAAGIGRGVLAALRAAHGAGIQHRDVKPANVLLRPDGTPVLTDFGIAAMHDATALTATGALIGSPEYIAPERIRGNEGDPASDLWSLGMMLYVALEGHHPLRRGTSLATLAAVLDEPLPPPVRCGELGPLLSALLTRDPSARPDVDRIDRALAAAEATGGHIGGPPSAPAPWPQTFPDTPRPGQLPSAEHTPWPGQNAWPGQPSSAGQNSWPGQPSSAEHTPWPGQAGPGGVPAGLVTSPADRTTRLGRPLPAGASPSTWPATPGRPAAMGRAPRSTIRRITPPALSAAALAVTGVVIWTLVPFGNAGGGAAAQNGATGPASSSRSSGPAGAPPASQSAAQSAPAPTAAGSNTPPAAAAENLLTPAGLRTVIEAMRPSLSDGRVTELTVYPEYASAQAPTPADPSLFDELDYRDGKVTRTPGGTMSSDDETSDLRSFDWDALPALLKTAQATLNVPDPTSRYLIIGPDMFDGKPTIRVYLSNAYGSGFLWADAKGSVKRSHPRGS